MPVRNDRARNRAMLTIGGLLSWFIVMAFRLRQSVGAFCFGLDLRR